MVAKLLAHEQAASQRLRHVHSDYKSRLKHANGLTGLADTNPLHLHILGFAVDGIIEILPHPFNLNHACQFLKNARRHRTPEVDARIARRAYCLNDSPNFSLETFATFIVQALLEHAEHEGQAPLDAFVELTLQKPKEERIHPAFAALERPGLDPEDSDRDSSLDLMASRSQAFYAKLAAAGLSALFQRHQALCITKNGFTGVVPGHT